MSPDEKKQIYDAGFKSGSEHQDMSPMTKEKLILIEQEVKEIKNNLSQQEVTIAEISKDIEFIKNSLNRIETGMTVLKEEKEKDHTEMKKDITDLKIWKVQFVAKWSVYGAIGLFLGSIASNILIKILIK